MGSQSSQRGERLRARWGRRVAICAAALTLAAGTAAITVAVEPSLVPRAVDAARGVFGPELVGQVEALAARGQDTARRTAYHVTGASAGLSWAESAPNTVAVAVPNAAPNAAPAAEPAPPPSRAAELAPPPPPGEPSDNAVPVPAAIVWQLYVAGAKTDPLLSRVMIAPDPDRPYASAALVRIDLRQTRVALVPGTTEPASPVKAHRPGLVPADVAASGDLVAAFNGGFKAVNGGFGMAVGGTTLLPPRGGRATLGIDADGMPRIGVWGVDLSDADQLAALRQNCPLLVNNSVPTEEAGSDDAALWGKTVGNKIATWRSGLGISADGRYLIYAVGDTLTVPTLARALVIGGAARGMQLDINSYWTRFVTYGQPKAGAAPQAQKLLAAMQGDPRQFIAPDTRDFFYIIRR